MRSFGDRFKGALLLDVSLYEEVEADQSALSQAMAVVVISSVASGIGLGIRSGLFGLIMASVASLIGWFLWAGITYFVGTRILHTSSTSSSWGEVLRTTGFSAAPGVFRIFSIIPFLGALIAFVVGIWMLVAFVIAVRQALDYESTWRAVAVCLTGWLVFVFFGLFFSIPIG